MRFKPQRFRESSSTEIPTIPDVITDNPQRSLVVGASLLGWSLGGSWNGWTLAYVFQENIGYFEPTKYNIAGSALGFLAGLVVLRTAADQ